MSKFSREEGGDKGRKREGSDRKPTGSGDRKPFNKGANGGDRKTFGEKRSYNGGDKKPFRAGDDNKERKSYGKKEDTDGRKSFGDKKPFRSEGGDGERRPYGKREDTGDRKSFGEKRPFDRDKKPFSREGGDRDRKPYGKSEGGDRKNFGEKRPFDRDKKPFSREGGDRDRKPYGKSEGGDRKSFGEKRPFDRDKKPFSREGGDRDRKPYGKREGGDRKSFGEKRPFDRDKKPFSREGGDRDRKPYGKREDSDRKSFGEKRPFDRDKKPFSREGGDKDHKPYGKREDDPRDFKKDNDRPRKPGAPADDNGKSAFKTPHRYKRDVKEEQDFAAEQPEEGKRTKKRRKVDEDEEDEDEKEQKEMWPMPLNKYIAHSGECSRREAAELVKQGKVKVNGELVTDPGRRVEESDLITLVGKKLTPSKHFVYILLNKPKGFITTTDDPQERRTVMELVANSDVERLYPVGRLDRNTTGLLLMTNDGALTQKLSHPGYEVKKVYQITLDKPLTKVHFEQIAAGLELEDGPVKVDEIAYLEDKKDIGLEIHSGRNRIVRRIFESLGYVVEKLDRMMYAGLTKKNLPRSKWRFLSEEEVIRLKHFKS